MMGSTERYNREVARDGDRRNGAREAGDAAGEPGGNLAAQAQGLILLDRLRAALVMAGLGPDHLDVPATPDPDGRTLAAALVLLYPWQPSGTDQTVPYLVLTRRTAALRRHSGQISLPGGRYDLEDGSLLRTALRETEEELGVPPDGLTIWGRLEPEWIVVTHYLLTAFVAYTPQRPTFRPAPAEVAEVIEMPLGLILDPASLAEEVWEMQGAPRQVSFYRHGEHKVWGATARILSQVAALLDPAQGESATFLGAAGESGRPRLAPGEVWPRSPRQPTV
jgi:8-oxo-dGTP pyrophosphatase MutT (NUDIX family)